MSSRGLPTFSAALQGIAGSRLSTPRQNHRGHPLRPHLFGQEKINFSQIFAGQPVGIKEVHDDIWLVSFMDYDLGYFDLETRVLEPLENPFGPKVFAVSGGRRNTSTEYIRRCPPVKSCSGSGIQFSSDSV
jgi:hypothetical protein